MSALQLCFRKPSRYMHHEIYQTRSLPVTCSLRFAYPVGTATMFSQAQSVHASRDLSNAVTSSYLLSTIRIPCRHCNYVFASPVGTCISRFIKHSHFQLLAIYDSHTLSALHLKVSQAQSVHASNIFSQAHAVGTSISRLSNAVTFYLHLWIRIPCV